VVGAGTLDVSVDGSTALACDADRASIFVVNIDEGSSTTVKVETEDRVGRALVGKTHGFVSAEGTGEILKIALEDATLSDRFPVCTSPRGLALSEDEALLHVACATGELVSLDTETGERMRRIVLDPDLKDVELYGEGLIVSRLRSAEMLILDAEGEETTRIKPADDPNFGKANVAWRMRVQDEAVYLLYQFSETEPLGATPNTSGGEDLSYGGGSVGEPTCGDQIVTPALTVFRPTSEAADADSESQSGEQPLFARATMRLDGAVGALDLGVNKDGIATVIAPGNAWAARPTRAQFQIDMNIAGDHVDSRACDETESENAPVGVAIAGDGRVILQGRQPATVGIIGTAGITTSSSSRDDSGHRLFHMKADRPISCVSCHPGGADDGHVWHFAAFGERRTQSLHGGVSHRERFHWDGSLGSFSELMSEVFGERMGMGEIPPLAANCLEGWLDELPDGENGMTGAEESVARGKALFVSAEVGCADCHNGPHFSDRQIHDVGTGENLVTPGLVGISARAPFMHDGCSDSLRARFDACGGGDAHGKTSHLDDEEVADLTAFLHSL
jgi:hypothetical protein